MSEVGRGRAFARAALAGNPSDLFGGAVLAVTVPAWAARAEAKAGAGGDLVEPANRLVEATLQRFGRQYRPDAQAFRVRWRTSIPQRVGLGSSSALVIAVTRALAQAAGRSLTPPDLAEFALAVEVDELGIAAGLQDRVAQAYEGLTFMDFSDGGGYESLGIDLLPALLIAWRSDAAGDSGPIHSGPRPAPGPELAAAAHAARAALLTGDHNGFARCVDETFDLRRRLMALDPRHVELIERARGSGAAANYTGSGGAIVAVCRDAQHRREVSAALSPHPTLAVA